MRSENSAPARQVKKFRELARTVVEHYFGSKPARLTYKSAGLSNFVFAAKHKEGDFIVRISPDQARLDAFIKEQWTERAAREAGVPTAEILETGFAPINFPYMITRSVDGLDATNHPDSSKIIRQMGEYASMINSIATRGFGETFDWSNNKLSLNETWEEFLTNEYRYEAGIEVLERSGVCPKETTKSLRKIFEHLAKTKAQGSLNHGDLRMKNLIVDEGGKILAIIDWEKATSNLAPQWELSLALHDLGIDDKQHFVEGYGLKSESLAEMAPVMKAFNLLNYAPDLQLAMDAGDEKALERFRLRFAGVFDLYTL